MTKVGAKSQPGQRFKHRRHIRHISAAASAYRHQSGFSMSPSSRILIVLVWLIFIAACGPSSAPSPPPTAVTAGAAPVPVSAELADPDADTISTDALLTRANAALKADQLFEPAGTSALDLYLAARNSATAETEATSAQPARRLTDAMAQVDPREQIQLAIADIFPSGLIWVERAMADDRRVEAERVLTLLEQAQPESIALDRLRDLLAQPEPAETVASTPVPSPSSTASGAAQTGTPRAATTDKSGSVFADSTPAAVAADPAAVVQSNSASAISAATTTVASATPPRSASSQTSPAKSATPQAPSDVTASTTTDSAAARPTAQRAPAAPMVLSQAAPRYPPRALKQRLEGWVLVGFTIRPDGRVDDVSVLNAEPAGVFDREAVGSMQRWQSNHPAKPSPRNGGLISSWLAKRDIDHRRRITTALLEGRAGARSVDSASIAARSTKAVFAPRGKCDAAAATPSKSSVSFALRFGRAHSLLPPRANT